jgi:DnaJ family protein A protein 2
LQPDSKSPGDLHIQLVLLPHPTFALHPPSLDLHTTLSLTLSESLLGFSRLILIHLDGRGLRVSQPGPGEPGWRLLRSGEIVVVKGEGMRGKNKRGDLRCKIEVELPKAEWASTLSVEQVRPLFLLSSQHLTD